MLADGTNLQNRYRILSLLGQGGMGAVYKAWDMRLNVPVAVKEMTSQPGLDPRTLDGLRQQFQQEATVLARLSHPNLVRVSDFFEEGGNAYLVMEFVEGQSLADLIAEQGALPEAQVLAWADQLLDALDYCHRQGVIHRDIKPQNIIISPSPVFGGGAKGGGQGEGRPVLVDFGLVKLWDPRDPRTQTVMRGMGTPEYAPPEQYGVSGHTDPRSDLYSLGATLYHALTGQPPLSATERMARPGQFRPLRDLAPGVRVATEAAVMRAMELAVDARFASAAEMRAALRTGGIPAAFAPTPPPPPTTRAVVPPPPVAAPVTPWLWVGLGGAGLLLAVLCLVVVLNLRFASPPPPVATTPVLSATPSPVAAETPVPSPTPLPQPCPLRIGQPVRVGENTRVWPQPDVLGTNFVMTLTPGVSVYIADGPQWGRIRKDIDYWGWWWYIRENPATDGLGWVWEGRIVECGASLPPPTATRACPAVSGPFATVWAQVRDRVGCATGNAIRGLVAEENFERGKMFWREPIDTAQALVLFNNGTWHIHHHSPYPGEPEFWCPDANTPAQCPPTPKRGFGMMWCDIPAIRQGLGWATDCERGYQGWMQSFERGFMLQTDTGAIYVFTDDGTWQRW